MSADRPSADNIPTLTEVVDWPADEPASVDEPQFGEEPQLAEEPQFGEGPHAEPDLAPPGGSLREPGNGESAGPDDGPDPMPQPGSADAVDADGSVPRAAWPAAGGDIDVAPAGTTPHSVDLARAVLDEVQRQINLVLDVRLREALAPVLARTADAMVRDARRELTAAMRDVVTRAVRQEMARRNDR